MEVQTLTLKKIRGKGWREQASIAALFPKFKLFIKILPNMSRFWEMMGDGPRTKFYKRLDDNF